MKVVNEQDLAPIDAELAERPVLPGRMYVQRRANRDPFTNQDQATAWEEVPVPVHMAPPNWLTPRQVLDRAKRRHAMELLLARRDITHHEMAQELGVDARRLTKILNDERFKAKYESEFDARLLLVVGSAWDWIENVIKSPATDKETLLRKDAMARYAVNRYDKIQKVLHRQRQHVPQNTAGMAQELLAMAQRKSRSTGQKVQVAIAATAEPAEELYDLGDLAGETFGMEVKDE